MAAEIRRHGHAAPYATLVLSGGYEEAGDSGRHRVGAGAVLIHGDFSAHRDMTERRPTSILDLPLPPGQAWAARGCIDDPDAIVRLAERDATAAAALLLATLIPDATREEDLVDLLATALIDDARIAAWAQQHDRSRETVSRQFRRLYGVDAARYRAEARARRAWRSIISTGESLADIAADSGHADQAHMTRAVRALTGATPGAWRQSHRFKTG